MSQYDDDDDDNDDYNDDDNDDVDRQTDRPTLPRRQVGGGCDDLLSVRDS